MIVTFPCRVIEASTTIFSYSLLICEPKFLVFMDKYILLYSCHYSETSEKPFNNKRKIEEFLTYFLINLWQSLEKSLLGRMLFFWPFLTKR